MQIPALFAIVAYLGTAHAAPLVVGVNGAASVNLIIPSLPTPSASIPRVSIANPIPAVQSAAASILAQAPTVSGTTVKVPNVAQVGINPAPIVSAVNSVVGDAKGAASSAVAQGDKIIASVVGDVNHIASSVISQVKAAASSAVAQADKNAAPIVSKVEGVASSILGQANAAASSAVAQGNKAVPSIVGQVNGIASSVIGDAQAAVSSVASLATNVVQVSINTKLPIATPTGSAAPISSAIATDVLKSLIGTVNGLFVKSAADANAGLTKIQNGLAPVLAQAAADLKYDTNYKSYLAATQTFLEAFVTFVKSLPIVAQTDGNVQKTIAQVDATLASLIKTIQSSSASGSAQATADIKKALSGQTVSNLGLLSALGLLKNVAATLGIQATASVGVNVPASVNLGKVLGGI